MLRGMVDVRNAPAVAPDPEAYGPVGRSAWLDVDWREHQRWVQVAGAPVNVIDLGAGDPIVFVHGLSGCVAELAREPPPLRRATTA